jgi:peptide/nickel transport system permease protein
MSALRSPLVVVGGAVVVAVAAAAVFAPVVAPYDPTALSGGALEPPSADHLLGTDVIGQDVFSRILWGARSSLLVGGGAAGLAIVVAILVGVLSALAGRRVDVVVMRILDVALALPRLPLLVLVGALVGPSRIALILLIAFVFFPGPARIFRSQALNVRTRGFIEASQGFGGGSLYLLRRHVVPAMGPIVIEVFVALIGRTILFAATLAFLGLADPTEVSWGLMLNQALLETGLYFTPAWTWLVLPAGFAITLVVLGFTFLGVGLEPLLNPRWKRGL